MNRNNKENDTNSLEESCLACGRPSAKLVLMEDDQVTSSTPFDTSCYVELTLAIKVWYLRVVKLLLGHVYCI